MEIAEILAPVRKSDRKLCRAAVEAAVPMQKGHAPLKKSGRRCTSLFIGSEFQLEVEKLLLAFTQQTRWNPDGGGEGLTCREVGACAHPASAPFVNACQ